MGSIELIPELDIDESQAFNMIIAGARAMGWVLCITTEGDDDPVDGMIIGTEDYCREVIPYDFDDCVWSEN